MPVRALVLLAVLAVSIVPALAEEYGYFADDDFTDTDYGTDERGGDQYDRYDRESGQQYDHDTHRFEDYVRVEYVETGRSRPARVAHYTPGEPTMPGELTEPVYTDYEELPLEAYEEFGSCDACVGDDLCDDCQAACDSCAYGCGGLSAGAEMTILNFHPDDDSEGGFGGLNADLNYELSPRVWIGYEGGDGWGFRGRYWQYDAELSDTVFLDEDNSYVLVNLNHQLDVYTVDFEFTKRFCVGQTAMRWSIGGRNGAIRRRTAIFFGTVDDDGAGEDATIGVTEQSKGFEGTGLTFALEANRPLFCSRLEAVCNARGSVLWGENDFSVGFRSIEAEPDGMGNLDVDVDTQSFDGEENSGMWIGELQAGLQWTQPYQCFGGGVMFVRSVFEAQWWAYPSVDTTDFGTIPSEDLAFYGLAFSAGFSH